MEHSVDYVHSQTREELLRFGVNQEPTLDLMLDVLKSWAGHETGQDCGNDWFSRNFSVQAQANSQATLLIGSHVGLWGKRLAGAEQAIGPIQHMHVILKHEC
eukprot:379174-Pelagomonas_calceolata.AAC.1